MSRWNEYVRCPHSRKRGTLVLKSIPTRIELGNERGQTSLEYLLLLAVAFITTYIMMTQPIANFTTSMIQNVRGGLGNVVQNAEWTGGPEVQVGDPKHPSNPARMRALHLK